MKKRNSFSFFTVIICIFAISAGCMGGRKLWRSYERKPFNAERWQKAGAIERGTMSHYLVGSQPIREYVGTSKTEIIKTLGEPNKIRKDKIGERDATVLMYEVDLGEPEFINALQIYLENEKPLFANFGVIREKENLLDTLKKKLRKNENKIAGFMFNFLNSSSKCNSMSREKRVS